MVERNFQATDMNVQEMDFGQPVVNIGSHPENDIKLTGSGVLPFHATVIFQDGKYNLIPFSPDAQIRQGGKLLDSAPLVLTENQGVEIGGYSLAFRHNGSPTSIHVILSQVSSPEYLPIGSIPLPATKTATDVENAILVKASKLQAETDVDQSVTYELEIVNAGPIVASFFVAMHGLPGEWVEIRPNVINLFENQRATVSVTVTAPRSPASTAGKHTFEIQVTSPNYPANRSITQLSLLINPFYEFSLGLLNPREQRISWRRKIGAAVLPIFNKGNSPVDFNVSSLDDENGCSFDFRVSDEVQLNRQATININAGTATSLPIEITPIKRPIIAFRGKRYQYTTTVQVAQQTTAPQIVSGSVTTYPLFGWWSIVLAAALIVLGLFVLLQPRIQSFDVAAGKNIIELGDSTRLLWSVSPFATRLNISNLDQAITYGQTSQTITPKQSTTYELVAGNWLSGLFNIDQKRIQTVLVVPPSPIINVFAVDNTSVARGKPVKIRWSVSQADKAILTIAGVVYELTPDKFSGEQSVVLDKDALVTLDAQNASGSELRSYFISVVEPSVTVNSFIVWVRPQAAASANPGQNTLASVTGGESGSFSLAQRVPQILAKIARPSVLPAGPVTDSFTEKYVALIPDASSDSKYRVEFYQPKRELSKGEQVMIEWNVDGTDSNSVQIAPFTEVLPSKGRQPFFPQESMNFVMTAQSGDQKKLFMLPVVVFDGTPPTAPKIDIFQGSPLSMVGPSTVQFAWSVSGEWTRIQLASGKGVVADYLTPQGFKKVNVTTSDTFILTAWNGKLSAAIPLNITVNPALIAPGLVIKSVQPTTGRFQVGGQVIVTVAFNSIPTGKPYPTGNVIVTDGSAICPIQLPASTCSLKFTTSGLKTITASFPGDTIYQQSNAPGFAQVISVASSQVDLTPVYYFNGGTSPIAVESSFFDMDKGLHTIVEVRPKNTVLADNNGNISISICDQDASQNIISSTCSFIGAAQVKVASTSANGQTAGYGYADIVIQNFNASGVRAFLFEYSHSANAIDPTSVTQPNIHINRSKLGLSLSTCADPATLTSCTFGLTENVTPEITFDLNIPGSSGPIPLSSLLPSPKASAFTITSVPAVTWTCAIKVVSGTYKLVCQITGAGFVSGTTYNVTYNYDNTNPLPGVIRNDYYMGTDPSVQFQPITFQLKVLASTKVILGNLSGVKVGERIHLTGPTGGIISILTNANIQLFPSTGVTLEEKSGADVFGVENEGQNCSRSAGNGSKIIITAANADCDVYFKHTGSYTLVATFAGDTQNHGSISGDTQVSVLKQTQITSDIRYFDTSTGIFSAFPSSWTTNRDLPVRVILDGPLSNYSTSIKTFPPTALVGRKLLITFNAWATANCTVNTGTGSLVTDAGGGVYEVEISQKAVGDPTLLQYVTTADFTLRCTQPNTLGLSFTLTFSDKTTPKKDSDDFGFALASVGEFNIAISLPSLGSMTVSVLRQDTAKTEMITGTSIGKLHFGQRYSVGIPSSSNILVPYQYQVHYTYTYVCPLGISCSLASTTNDIDPAVASSNTRNAIFNSYSNNAKWSLDPANFLNLGTNLGTNGSTCGLNMTLTPTNKTPNPPSEYSYWSLVGWDWHWEGVTLVYSYTYQRSSYGNMTISLGTPAAQYCTLVFDSASVNTPFTDTTGTIAISAVSGDGLFAVNSTYNVQGIDKQTSSMSFNPSTAVSAFTNTGIPFTISLSATDFTGGTALPFIDTNQKFEAQFSPTIDPTCTSMTTPPAGNTVTPTIVESFISTAVYSGGCNNKLSYLGNKYFKSTLNQSLPTITIAGHTSKVTITSPITTKAFPSVGYSFSVAVADGDTPAHSLVPTGSIKVQLLNGTTPVALSNYTISGGTQDATNILYTLPLTGGAASFTATFNPALKSSTNITLSVQYPGDAANFSSNSATVGPFSIDPHLSSTSVTASTIPGAGPYWGVDYPISVSVTDNDSPAHAVNRTGSLKIQLLDIANAAIAISNYTISGTGVTSDAPNNAYNIPLTSNAANFTLNLSSALANTSIKLSVQYSGDTNFASSSSTTSYTVQKHATAVGSLSGWSFTNASPATRTTVYPISTTVTDSTVPSNIPAGTLQVWVTNSSNVEISGTDYTIAGATAAGTRYNVTFSGGIVSFNLTFNSTLAVQSGLVIHYQYLTTSNLSASNSATTAAFAVQ